MKFIPKKINTKRLIAIVLIAAFVISLIPMLYISKYTFPSEDDFSYGRLTKNVYADTGSFFKVLGASFTRAISMYKSWQGTFSGLMVMSIGPYIYGMQYYALTPFILLFMMVVSTLFFTYKLVHKYFGLDIWTWIVIALVLLMAQIQFMQYPNSSFYWYNGSSLYMTFYCSALVVYGLMVDILMAKPKKKYWLYAIAVPLSAFTATGNFVISLNFAIVTAFVVLYLVITKNKLWKKALPIFIIALAGLIFITAAPGNSVRVSEQNADASALEAVALSFKNAFLYLFKPHYLIESKYFGALFVLVLLPFTGKIITNDKFKFRYPALILLLAFCVFASVMTPTLYGLGHVKLPRVNNLVFFFYIWMVVFDLIYIAGWLYRKINQKSSGVSQSLISVKNYFLAIYFAVIFIIGIISFLGIDIHNPKQMPTTIRAAQVIRHQTGKTFARENKARLDMLYSDESELVFAPYTAEPDLLFYNDMGEDPTEWFNRIVAEYFDKDSVIVAQPAESE